MHTETIEYLEGDTTLEGFLAYDSSLHGKLPLVLIFHAWGGRNDFVCEKAKEIALHGYAAFAVDMYGKGVLGKDKEENMALATPFFEDRTHLIRRAIAGLSAAEGLEVVDCERIAAMGYCFGGMCALDLARSGADLKGAISIHGNLSAPEKPGANKIYSKILVLHGHRDPLVPPEQVRGFENEMEHADVDWQLHAFGNAMHAFTVPGANDPDLGTLYDEQSSRRTDKLVEMFLKETIG